MSKSWMKAEIKGNLNKVKSIDSNKVDTFKTKEAFDIQYIDISKIVKNKFNFYPIINIDELARDIEENGLSHNLMVRPLDDKYEIISGERRFTALKKLQESGMEEFNKLPCKVIEADDIQAMIMLIQANAQSRELTESLKLKQVKLLNELYAQKKKNKTMLTKEIQEEISKSLNLSISQVKKYEAISKATDTIQENFANNNLSFTDAASLARLSEKGQNVAMEIIKDTNNTIDPEKVKKDIQIIEKEFKKNNIDEKSFDKKLEIIKDKYINPNKANDESLNEVTSKLVKNQIKNVNKRIEDIISNISELTKVDEELLQKIDELESAVLAVRKEANLINNNM